MQSVADFFNLASPQDLVWEHGVFSRDSLMRAAADQALHVAVANVRYANGDALPMIAESLESASDVDVMTWVMTLQAAGKAVKLDFLEPSAVEPVMQVLHRLQPVAPMMLHANVFALLPHSERKEGLEPEQFFKLAQRFAPRAVLSIGWSLKRTHDADGRLEEALIEQLADMSLHRLGGNAYDIEIRAGYTPGHERGAALIFDPLDAPLPPAARFGDSENIVDAVARFRRAA